MSNMVQQIKDSPFKAALFMTGYFGLVIAAITLLASVNGLFTAASSVMNMLGLFIAMVGVLLLGVGILKLNDRTERFLFPTEDEQENEAS